MTIETRIVGTVAVLQVHGKLTVSTGERALRSAAQSALENGCLLVVINLHDVAAIDSSGIADIVSIHTTVTNRGGRIKICELSPRLREIFAITHLDTVLYIYETEAEAMASVR